MRRDFELVRNILLAIADKDLTDSNELIKELEVAPEILSYHLELLAYDAILIKAKKNETGFGFDLSTGNKPEWQNIKLTWEGNDFVDSIGNNDIWKTIRGKLSSGASILTTEALKNAVKAGAWEQLSTIIAESSSSVEARKGNSSDTPRA